MLPAAVIAGNAEFSAAVAGVVPGGGHYLHPMRPIGRGAGRAVVGARRPHAGALRRRLRAGKPHGDDPRLSDVYRELPHLAAGRVLRAMRDSLGSHSRAATTPRVCLLTPGPLNETYFEHAYLARYLGLRSSRASDLTVRDKRSTCAPFPVVAGERCCCGASTLKFADPARAHGAVEIGRPRSGRRLFVRAMSCLPMRLGSGLAEKAALLGFMPALCATRAG